MKFLKIILLLLALSIALVATVFFLRNTWIKGAIEKGGSSIMGVPVSLTQTSTDVFAGGIQIGGLSIGNPPGFKSEKAFFLGNLDIAVDPRSLLSDTWIIRKFHIRGAEITSDGLLADNHRAILETVRKALPSSSPSPSDPSPKPGKKMIIDSFQFSESYLSIQVQGREVTRLAFPPLTLEGLGSKGSGVTAAEALTQIYTAILGKTTQVLTVNEGEISGLIQNRLQEWGIGNLDDLKDPKKLLQDPAKASKLLDAMGSLLKKD